MSEQTVLEKLWTDVNNVIQATDRAMDRAGLYNPEFWRGYQEGMLRTLLLIERAQEKEGRD